jgi:hypothetical protein
MSEKRAKMLEIVRGLLAKAASTPFEAEAETFRAKADQLMESYAIDEWEAAQGVQGSSARTPVLRHVDFSWYWKDEEEMYAGALWGLMGAVYRHVRCVTVGMKAGAGGGQTMPVIGLESDLDFADMLFTDLMIQLFRDIDPKVDPDKSYEENLRMFKEAGFNWNVTVERMQAAGYGTDMTPQKAYHKMSHDYRRYCKRTGIEQDYSNWKTYRRSYAGGFCYKVQERLRAMSAERQTEQTGSMAIALRDIRLVVNEAIFEFFPDLRNAKAMTRYKRDTRKADLAAMGKGSAAGAKARIASNAAGMRSPKKLT